MSALRKSSCTPTLEILDPPLRPNAPPTITATDIILVDILVPASVPAGRRRTVTVVS